VKNISKNNGRERYHENIETFLLCEGFVPHCSECVHTQRETFWILGNDFFSDEK